MWNFLVDRTRYGVKCDYSEHCGRAAGVRRGESAARLRPVGPTWCAGANAALRRRRRDARSRCARVRYTRQHFAALPRILYRISWNPRTAEVTMFWTLLCAVGRSNTVHVTLLNSVSLNLFQYWCYSEGKLLGWVLFNRLVCWRRRC